MTVCERCAAAVRNKLGGHLHESIHSLLVSSKVCPLCHFWVAAFGDDRVRKAGEFENGPTSVVMNGLIFGDGIKAGSRQWPLVAEHFGVDILSSCSIESESFTACTDIGPSLLMGALRSAFGC